MPRTRYTHLADGHMYTFSGTAFCLYDPQPEQVCILDIAHGLAKNVRFNGQICEDYMIAEHTLLISYLVPDQAFHALNHDNAEAYIGDMVRPMKYLEDMHPFREIEAAIEEVISEKYKFPKEKTPEIAAYDRFMADVEANTFFLKPPDWALKRINVEFPKLVAPTMDRVLIPKEAEWLWLVRYMTLKKSHITELIDEAVNCNKGVISKKQFENYYKKLCADANISLNEYTEIQLGVKHENIWRD